MSQWIQIHRVDRFGIGDAVLLDPDGIGAGCIFWSRLPDIESRFSIYVGLFCLNPSSIPGYA